MPTCKPAERVTFATDQGTCAGNSLSAEYRSAVIKKCRLGETLTQEWWRPDSETVAFFHIFNVNEDSRIVPRTGAIDCGG